MRELRSAFAPKGLTLIQAVPFDDPEWDYKSYAETTGRSQGDG
jgi:hypothetical protein